MRLRLHALLFIFILASGCFVGEDSRGDPTIGIAWGNGARPMGLSAMEESARIYEETIRAVEAAPAPILERAEVREVVVRLFDYVPGGGYGAAHEARYTYHRDGVWRVQLSINDTVERTVWCAPGGAWEERDGLRREAPAEACDARVTTSLPPELSPEVARELRPRPEGGAEVVIPAMNGSGFVRVDRDGVLQLLAFTTDEARLEVKATRGARTDAQMPPLADDADA